MARLRCLKCGHTWSPAEHLGDAAEDFQQWLLRHMRGSRVPATCPKCRSGQVSVIDYE